MQFSSFDETAVCNLASIALPSFVTGAGRFDYIGLHKVVKVVTLNLNRVIDRTFYPVKEAAVSNLRHRPIGIGIQGLADVFMALKIPYDSIEARDLNMGIFETMYHAALESSCEIAACDGPYESWAGCEASFGRLQYDLWKTSPSLVWNWELLKNKIECYGLRNSLLIAPMPTAGTSQIFGFTECFEPCPR